MVFPVSALRLQNDILPRGEGLSRTFPDHRPPFAAKAFLFRKEPAPLRGQASSRGGNFQAAVPRILPLRPHVERRSRTFRRREKAFQGFHLFRPGKGLGRGSPPSPERSPHPEGLSEALRRRFPENARNSRAVRASAFSAQHRSLIPQGMDIYFLVKNGFSWR